jgi:hypothetical protein
MKMKRLAISFAIAMLCSSALAMQQLEDPASGADALRVYVDGKRILGEADLMNKKFANDAESMATFKRNIISIRRNASVALLVEKVNRNGQVIDVTKDARTRYQSLAPFRLSVSSDGIITAAPTPEAPFMLGGDLAILIQYEGQGAAWNKVFVAVAP